MKTVAPLTLLLSCLVMGNVTAQEYASVGQLMRQAIDASEGRAEGIVFGPVTRKFSEVTKSHSPVRAEITTLRSFSQEGCKRLNVRLRQANEPTADGRVSEFGFDYQINLCRDGSPPEEGFDHRGESKAIWEAGKITE